MRCATGRSGSLAPHHADRARRGTDGGAPSGAVNDAGRSAASTTAPSCSRSSVWRSYRCSEAVDVAAGRSQRDHDAVVVHGVPALPRSGMPVPYRPTEPRLPTNETKFPDGTPSASYRGRPARQATWDAGPGAGAVRRHERAARHRGETGAGTVRPSGLPAPPRRSRSPAGSISRAAMPQDGRAFREPRVRRTASPLRYGSETFPCSPIGSDADHRSRIRVQSGGSRAGRPSGMRMAARVIVASACRPSGP